MKTLFVDGDSYAVHPWLKGGVKRSDVRYIKCESKDDSYGFTKNHSSTFQTKPAVFDFLENEARSGGIVA